MISNGLSFLVQRNRVISLHYIAYCYRANFLTEKLKTTFYSYVVTLGARKSTGLTWTCFQFHLKSYTAIQLVGELVCRVQGGNSHTSSFLAGWLEGWPLLALPQNSMELM